MLFYDFEVFKFDWLVVVMDTAEKKKHVIINDPEALKQLYEAHVNDIWTGFNSRSYDQYILKGILCGFDPKRINDYIIVKKKKGWQFSSTFRSIPLNNFDVMPNPPVGLKTLEAFMGSDIRETEVPFNIDRKLTPKEIDQTVFYCTHDVEQTMEVFIKRKEQFEAMLTLVKQFKLPISDLGKTEAAITAKFWNVITLNVQMNLISSLRITSRFTSTQMFLTGSRPRKPVNRLTPRNFIPESCNAWLQECSTLLVGVAFTAHGKNTSSLPGMGGNAGTLMLLPTILPT